MNDDGELTHTLLGYSGPGRSTLRLFRRRLPSGVGASRTIGKAYRSIHGDTLVELVSTLKCPSDGPANDRELG